MSSIFWLIPISLVFLGVAILAFFWAVKSQQFEDLDSPARHILLDEVTERWQQER